VLKTWCEELKQPGSDLRTLDFKRARRAVQRGDATHELTLEGAKASLRAFAACKAASSTALNAAAGGTTDTSDKAARSSVTGVTAAGLARGLGLDPASPRAHEVWRILVEATTVAAEEERLSELGVNSSGSSSSAPHNQWDRSSLDVYQWIISLHRSKPPEVVAAGWLTDFGIPTESEAQSKKKQAALHRPSSIT